MVMSSTYRPRPVVNRWSSTLRTGCPMPNPVIAALRSHLVAGIDRLQRHLHEGQAALREGLETPLERSANVFGIFDPFAVTVEGARDGRIIGRRRDRGSDERVRFHRPAVGIMVRDAGLLREIAGVVEEYRHDGHAVLLADAERREHRIVVERSVADDGDDR